MASNSAGIGGLLPPQTTDVNGYILTTDGQNASWEAVSGVSGVTTMSAVASTPNDNGATISGNFLALQPADATHPGVVTAGTQSFGGAKTFASTIAASNFSGSSSGTNTGDITLSAFGSTPDAKGAILTAQALALQPADATHPGLVTAGAQTFGGAKTFGTQLAINPTDGGLTTPAFNVGIGVGGAGQLTANATHLILYTSASIRLIAGGSSSVYVNAASLDLTGFGAGGAILLKSPNGTTYTMTIANGGTLSIT